MDHPRIADFRKLTSGLADAGIDFILVGGAAASLHGSSYPTSDYDIVHSRAPENLPRLLQLLSELDAIFRGQLSGRRITPNESHLTAKGQILLSTTLGPLDLLCQLHDGRGYEELLPHTVTADVDGKPLRILDLPTLIEVKTAAGRPKDLLVVAELLPILDRLTRG